MNEFELHSDRLGTTDELGRRIFPQPADVRGKYRIGRMQLQAILIFVFLGLPWLRIGNRQALLFDIANRRFEFFGLSLRAHNAPLLVLVLGAALFGLFFVTAIWGRIWCGWACPQTVFIDGVFRRIERWIEGGALERRKLDRSPMTVRKFRLRSVKWTLYLFVSLILAHSFLAYFVGTDLLAKMMTQAPTEHWTSFSFMAALTGVLVFNFGWFREQFCVIACPYGRFQSVIMDSSSMIVAYDVDRGEPRATPQAKVLQKTHGGKLGDCVNCYRCVQVCPVGIDIRRGLQMECIACTACADACDEVMTKVKKPTGLIRYDSLLGLKNKSKSPPRFTPRAGFYGLGILTCVLSLVYFLEIMKPVDITLLRASGEPYQVQSGLVINHFKLEISNQSDVGHELDFASAEPGLELVTALRPVPVEANDISRSSLFIRVAKDRFNAGQKTIKLRILDTDKKTGKTLVSIKEVTLVGPFN